MSDNKSKTGPGPHPAGGSMASEGSYGPGGYGRGPYSQPNTFGTHRQNNTENVIPDDNQKDRDKTDKADKPSHH